MARKGQSVRVARKKKHSERARVPSLFNFLLIYGGITLLQDTGIFGSLASLDRKALIQAYLDAYKKR